MDCSFQLWKGNKKCSFISHACKLGKHPHAWLLSSCSTHDVAIVSKSRLWLVLDALLHSILSVQWRPVVFTFLHGTELIKMKRADLCASTVWRNQLTFVYVAGLLHWLCKSLLSSANIPFANGPNSTTLAFIKLSEKCSAVFNLKELRSYSLSTNNSTSKSKRICPTNTKFPNSCTKPSLSTKKTRNVSGWTGRKEI